MSITRSASALNVLVEKMKKPDDHLIPDCLNMGEQRVNDDELWKSIRGVSGLWRMFYDTHILLAMGVRTSDCTAQYDHERELAFILRVAILIALLEGALLACFPRLPVPRFIARFAFNQYCELCASVRAVIEFEYPCLIERFDALV